MFAYCRFSIFSGITRYILYTMHPSISNTFQHSINPVIAEKKSYVSTKVDRRTDERTDPLVQMRERIQKTRPEKRLSDAASGFRVKLVTDRHVYVQTCICTDGKTGRLTD